jgi:hypothetical protein
VPPRAGSAGQDAQRHQEGQAGYQQEQTVPAHRRDSISRDKLLQDMLANCRKLIRFVRMPTTIEPPLHGKAALLTSPAEEQQHSMPTMRQNALRRFGRTQGAEPGQDDRHSRRSTPRVLSAIPSRYAN